MDDQNDNVVDLNRSADQPQRADETANPSPHHGEGASDHRGPSAFYPGAEGDQASHLGGAGAAPDRSGGDVEGRKEPVSIDPVGTSQVLQERNPLSAEEHMERENRRKGEMEQAQREEAEAAEVLRRKSAARHDLTARHNAERQVQDPAPREVDRVIPHYDASSGQMKPVRSTVRED